MKSGSRDVIPRGNKTPTTIDIQRVRLGALTPMRMCERCGKQRPKTGFNRSQDGRREALRRCTSPASQRRATLRTAGGQSVRVRNKEQRGRAPERGRTGVPRRAPLQRFECFRL